MNRLLAKMESKQVKPAPQFDWYGDEILKRIIRCTLAGLVAIPIYAAYFDELNFLSYTSTGLLLAGATFASGAFLGFLFGIPRSGAVAKDKETAGDNGKFENTLQANTNLEQISDWLTKIIVGVSLTQIRPIINHFTELVSFFAGFMGTNRGIVAAIIIFFLVAGFMLGFLWSRLYMAGAIRVAEKEANERSLVERITEEIQYKVDEQASLDAKALAMVNQQLDPAMETVATDLLKNALEKASPVIKVTVFNMARAFRKRVGERKHDLTRCIPVFTALTQIDKQNKYHRNYAELGYALKDQEPPACNESEKALTQAIDIRNNTSEAYRWSMYEFNRAVCRIKINSMQPATPFSKEAIQHDLQRAGQSAAMAEIMAEDPTVQAWLKANY